MRLTTARDQFIADRRIGGPGRRQLGSASLQRYYFSLSTFVDWLTVTQSTPSRSGDSVLRFTAETARDFIAHRSAAPSTLGVDCAVLREFARWGVRKRYWKADDVAEMPTVVQPHALPRPMSPEERDRVMALPLAGADVLLRALLYYTGCRESELLALRLLDVTTPHALPDGSAVPGSLRVWGKGRKERIVPMHDALWEILRPHLAGYRGRLLDCFLLSRGEGNTPWSPRMVINRVRAWGLAASVPGLVPHRFRHSFATDALEWSNDLRAVQELLGHTQVTTTQRYTRVVDRRRTAVVAGLPTFAVNPPSLPAFSASGHAAERNA